MQPYIDMYELAEDKRIELIGNTAMCKEHDAHRDTPVTVAFIVEDDEKADRYIKKLQARFPGIRVIERVPYVANTIAVKLAPPLT